MAPFERAMVVSYMLSIVTVVLCMYVCMYVYSHKQSPMYNVNTEQDKKCRTER